MLDVIKAIIGLDYQLRFDAFTLKERSRARWNLDATKCLSSDLPEHHRNHRPWIWGVIWHPGVPEAHVPENDGAGFDRRLNRRMANAIAFEVVWFDDAFDITAVRGVEVGCWPELCCAIGGAHVNDRDVYDDCGGWRVVAACDGMRRIGMDRLCVIAGEGCVSGVEAILDGAAQNLLSDVDDDVVEQNIFKEVWLEGRRCLLDIAFIEVEWRICPCQDFFDIRQHHIPQGIDMRRVDDIFDDHVTICIEVSYSPLNVHSESLPMRGRHWCLEGFTLS